MLTVQGDFRLSFNENFIGFYLDFFPLKVSLYSLTTASHSLQNYNKPTTYKYLCGILKKQTAPDHS